MSKRKRQQRSSAPSKKRKQRSNSSTSLAIPIIVGLVVIAILVVAVISIENRRSAASALAGSGSDPASVATAQALSTQQIPYPAVPRISLQETQDKLASAQVVLVDVRSRESFDRAHASGAISVPEEEIDSRLDELPQDKALVLY